jgi:hypothetical protein
MINYVGSIIAGLGMLLAFDREDDRGDLIAAGLLVISIAFSSVGLAFALGALMDVAFGRRPGAQRAYVVIVPLALYGVWWIGWGRNAQSYLSFHNLVDLPKFVFQSGGAAFTSALGLATNDGSEPSQPHLIWGELALVAFTVICAWRVVKAKGISRGLAVALAPSLAFWVLTGLERNSERFPTTSRYQYVSVVLILVVAAEVFRGARIPRPAIAVAAIACVLSVVGGISLTEREYHDRWLPAADSLRYSLTALQIGGAGVDPRDPVVFSPTNQVPAALYLKAARESGSPAFSEADLANAPQRYREGADLTLAQGLGLALRPPSRRQTTVGCQTLHASAAAYTGTTLLYGSFTLASASASPIVVLLGRFATSLPVSLGPLDPGLRASLTIPKDASSRPWNLGLMGRGAVRLCTTSAA